MRKGLEEYPFTNSICNLYIMMLLCLFQICIEKENIIELSAMEFKYQ